MFIINGDKVLSICSTEELISVSLVKLSCFRAGEEREWAAGSGSSIFLWTLESTFADVLAKV